MPFTADAVEHSQLTESETELLFLTPPELSVMMRAQDIQKALQALNAGNRRVKITVGQPNGPAPGAAPQRLAADEATERALANPEVQRFREIFPGAEVRGVRNLKE
jgi:hypothetical protein